MHQKSLNYYFISQKNFSFWGTSVPQTPYYFLCFSKIKQFPEIKYSISIYSWIWAIERVLEQCMLLFISNVCLKYAPKWMVSSSIFQKISGEGLTEPPPQTPPPDFARAYALGLGLRPQLSGASLPGSSNWAYTTISDLPPPMLERNLCMCLTKFFQPPLGNQLPPYVQFPSYGPAKTAKTKRNLTQKIITPRLNIKILQW